MRRNGTQRIGYFDGQLLTAHDLQDDAAFESRLRGLHVRALHNTWGVALGFAVKRIASKVVEVGPGIAYNCYGQEIISARTLNVGLPPAPGHSQAAEWTFDLVIHYLEREQAPGERRQVCVGSDVNPREERPAWRWRFAGDVPAGPGVPQARPEELRLGEEIPLARFVVTATGEISEPDFSVRRNAQGLVRPHIFADQAEGNLTFSTTHAAFTLTVNTSEAGFSQTPYYFARLTLPALLDRVTEDQRLAAMLRLLLGPFVTVRSPQRSSFQLDVRFAVAPPTDFTGTMAPTGAAAELLRILQADPSLLAAQVNWVGVEPTGGCAPPIQTPRFFLYFTPFVATFASTVARAGFDFD